jgi:Ni,Fe-hydrogenase III large subunit
LSWVETKNLNVISLNDIQILPLNDFRDELIKKIKGGKRLIQFFGNKETSGVFLYAVAADDNTSRLFITSCKFTDDKAYQSLTPEIPSVHLFEREFYEQFGIKPEGHPWLKPVRKGIEGINNDEPHYNFFSMTGEEIHEVGVGPIHAGIIEPGHFRFSCHGEKVYHLEIKLGFQHRGIENMFLNKNHKNVYLLNLSESIAGDSVIGHAGTYIRAMESLCNINVSRRVKSIRTVMLELERIAMHLADLSGLSGDIAYLTGSSVFGALRTKIINATMSICGNRFGRGMLRLSGVNFDITPEIRCDLTALLNKLNDDADLAAEVMFSSVSVLERFEKTGILEKETAMELGLVGLTARASGYAVDIRSDHPFDAYQYFPVYKLTLESGDVFARAYIRYIEIQQSIKIIMEILNNIPSGELSCNISSLQPDSMVISLTEGWRGEISHIILTDSEGKIKRIKIKDPSFNNWLALSISVRGEGISDFPLCNKSYNLSYSGFDL